MTMTEISRLIIGLRAAGWSEEKINNFLLYIAYKVYHLLVKMT